MTKRRLLELFEYGFTIFALLIYSGGPLQVILTGGASEGDGTSSATVPDFAIIRAICAFTYLVFGLLLIYRWKQALYGLYKGRIILSLTVLAVLSYLWSDFPSITLSRSIALVGTSVFGIYLGTRFTLRQQVEILGITFGLIVFSSLAFIVALPKYGIMGGIHAGAWRGIYNHKNVMGRIMVLSMLVFLVLATGARKHRLMLWGFVGLSAVLIVMSQSTTSLGNLIFLTTLFYVLQTTRWRYDIRILSLMAIILGGGTLYAWVLTHLEAILAAFGKDTTLTGRADLWPMVITMIERRPMFGYGYSGFWNGWKSGAGEIWAASGWQAPHSHNGFLDLSLDLGLLGLLIFAIEALLILTIGFIRLRRTTTSEHFFTVLFPLFILLFNTTESTVLGRNTLFWVVFIAIAISVRIPIPLPSPAEPQKVVSHPPLRLQPPPKAVENG